MLHPPPKKKKNHKMIYTAQEVKFFIKYFFIICDHIRRKLLYHIVVSVARNNKKYLKIDIYFNDSRCHFRPACPIHRNYPMDLLCKFFMYNDNTYNLIHHLSTYYFRLSWRHSSPLSLIVQPGQVYFLKTWQQLSKNSRKQFYDN